MENPWVFQLRALHLELDATLRLIAFQCWVVIFAAIFSGLSGALASHRHGRRRRLARCGDSRHLGDRLGDGQGHAASHVGTVVERPALGHRGVGALHAQDGAGRFSNEWE